MPVIAVLITGDPIAKVSRLTPNFGFLMREVVDLPEVDWVDIDLRQGGPLPDPSDFAACIITGSPHSVLEQTPWIRQAEAYVRRIRESRTGLFGICFGHQLMASALGGKISINPKGREMGVTLARPRPCNGKLGWPTTALLVPMSHRDSVFTAPAEAQVLFETPRDAHAALYYDELCCSTQFHPEFTPDVLRCYIEHYREALTAQGDDVGQVFATLRETPEARGLLHEFLRGILDRAHTRLIQRCVG